MGSVMSETWEQIRHVWWVLATAALLGFGAGGLAGDVWEAPQKAQDALQMARENNQAIQDLHRTVRIYICSDEGLDRSTRIRLRCGALR